MAAKSTNVVRGDWGAFYASIDNMGFDSSYTTGGYAVPSSVALQTIVGLEPLGGNTASQGYLVSYNTQTSKIQFFWPAGSAAVAAEITAGTNLSTVTVQTLAVGY